MKRYLKAEKRFNAKEGFYLPVILFDSGYKKDRNGWKNLFKTFFGEV